MQHICSTTNRVCFVGDFCLLIRWKNVVIVLRFLGLVVVCWSASEQPTASPPKWARVYCGFLTRTHPCDDPLRQDGEPSERQLVLAWFACAVVVVAVTYCGS